MRDIKFRQRNTNNGSFHYWGMVDGEWVNPLLQQNYVHPAMSDQYTGLKDKNGKEIYEGDVLYYTGIADSKEVKGIVSFEEGSFVTDMFGEERLIDLRSTHYNLVEVIGNIHENPELLGEK